MVYLCRTVLQFSLLFFMAFTCFFTVTKFQEKIINKLIKTKLINMDLYLDN